MPALLPVPVLLANPQYPGPRPPELPGPGLASAPRWVAPGPPLRVYFHPLLALLTTWQHPALGTG